MGPMRVLFATTGGAGHFGPLVPFASACVRSGHQVVVVGHASAGALVARAGLEFRPLAEPSTEEIARFHAGQEALSPIQAIERAASELYVDMYARTALPDMLETIEDWGPDVVVRESAEFSALIAAERLGVPYAQVAIGLSTALAERFFSLVAIRLDELRAVVGLAPNPEVRPARELVLTLAPASLEDPATPTSGRIQRFRLPADPVSSPTLDGWGDPNAPLVYVSFGTEVASPNRPYFPSLYRGVLEALDNLRLRLLVTIGDRRDPAELGPLAASVRVERWVEQSAVMRQAAVMVGHGGAGSVLGALAAGVPMALIPLFADQPLNARRIAELAAGVALEGGMAATPALTAAVPELLSDPGYHAAARRIADEIANLPPIDEAVGALATLTARP
jgi:UDP:flavonoid glycosyltransferase YjiC (YdhE family)